MKKHIFILGMALISLAFLSCVDGEDLPLLNLEGTYTGTFQRIENNQGGEIAQVTITFADNSWEGHSDTPKYPALCKGEFQVKSDVINFENHCMFTADFDWTLILKGDYKIERTESTVTLIKIYPENTVQVKDVYTLQIADLE